METFPNFKLKFLFFEWNDQRLAPGSVNREFRIGLLHDHCSHAASPWSLNLTPSLLALLCRLRHRVWGAIRSAGRSSRPECRGLRLPRQNRETRVPERFVEASCHMAFSLICRKIQTVQTDTRAVIAQQPAGPGRSCFLHFFIPSYLSLLIWDCTIT